MAYGERPRNRFDLFLPAAKPGGLVVFVHGGFWRALDKSFWSHLARGAVERGYAVAMPSYTLCPEVRIADITREIGAAIEKAASMIGGPHVPDRSFRGRASGHADDLGDVAAAGQRSRAHPPYRLDLRRPCISRPLLATAMNADLRIDAAEAQAESPALLAPLPNTAAGLLGGRRGTPGIHPAERAARQHLDRARRADLHDRGARPAPF